MSECNRVGIDAGVYFVTQAITEEEAIEEANWVYDKVKNYKITYPIVIDTEQASPNERSKDLTKAERTEIIKAFCDRIEELGYKSQIYSGKYWFKDKLNMDDLQGYDIWVAEYTHNANGKTSFEHDYSIWQYTDKGVVDGINGVCDVNNCYVNYNPKKTDEGGKGFWDLFR
jgi:GH25 family lysozyme M1 (1,4-beta-N-acetylmuramidase)